LATSDEAEAERLIGQLNVLLSSEEYWEPSARALAADRFDPRVVDIFFDGMRPTPVDGEALREEVIPLPTVEQGYRRILLVGTTGAGKTTLARQLLGTDPVTERFPSTSTAKTTIADTELIFAEGPFRVVVTFASGDEVKDHLTECLSEAALAAFRSATDAEILRRVLDHVNQRFRFSYVLGRGPVERLQDDEEDETSEGFGFEVLMSDSIDLEETNRVLEMAVIGLRDLVEEHSNAAREDVIDPNDERVLEEVIEENLDSELRHDENFHAIADSLMEEVVKRFTLLESGSVRKNRQGWPLSWSWECDDRNEFIRTVMRFSSNYAPLFGQLLTPLVSGIRVAGPFHPSWNDSKPPKLVLLDGEGLGHTASSAAGLSTNLAQRVETSDAVALVDSAVQPMLAAPIAAMKSIATSGSASKLIFCFTHFDEVRGDNLPGLTARQDHVLASAENVLKAIGEDLGPFAERILRKRLKDATFFFGGIQSPLDTSKAAGRRTRNELARFLVAVDEMIAAEPVEVRPVYDRVNLTLAVTEAARQFHETWRGILGLEPNPAAPKEHWARIKALSRRLAEGWSDEYDRLKPVAHLRQELQNQIYRMLQQPLAWDGGEPDEDDKQLAIDEFSKAITHRLFAFTSARIRHERLVAWQSAYALSGRGSTYVRAKVIAFEVYEQGVPIPSVIPSPDRNSFLHGVLDLFDEVAKELKIRLE
jgi:hypothetical protein